MTDNKLMKTAKTLDTVIKILQVIATIGMVAALVAALLMGAALIFDLPTEMIAKPDFTVTLDSYTLTLSEDIPIAMEKTFLVGIGTMLVMVVHLGLGYYFFKTLRAIFAPMKEGQPFHDSVSLNLKKLGYCGIAMCVMDMISEFVGKLLTATVYPLQEVFGNYVTHVDYTVEVNMAYLLLAGVCFLLSYIFSYGTQLQIQSDETL